MDLNDIKAKNCENSNDILRSNNLIIPKDLTDNCYSGQFDKENQYSTETQKISLYNNQDNFIFFYLDSQKSLDKNLVLVEKISAESDFLKLVDLKNEELGILLTYEKPNFTLLNFLMNNNIDISLRFLLFKQSLQIIFKLISLKEQFSFFNYSIFFVEDCRGSNYKTCLFKYFENSLKMKIFYHVEIKEYEKKLHLPSLNPYHWIYYIFCLVFKDLSIDVNSRNDDIHFINFNDQYTSSFINEIYTFLSDKIKSNQNSFIFCDFINMINPILNHYSLEEINLNNSNNGLTSINDNFNSFKYFSNVFNLPDTRSETLKISKLNSGINYGFQNLPVNNNFSYYNNYDYLQNQNRIFLTNNHMNHQDASNSLDKSICNNKIQGIPENLQNSNACKENNYVQNCFQNYSSFNISQNIKNNFTNQYCGLRKNSNLDSKVAQETCRNNNVYNINNYFQISNPRPNININGNIFNFNCNSLNYSNGVPSRNNNLNTYTNQFYDNCIDQKLQEFESKNRIKLFNYELFCLANNNNFDKGNGFFQDSSGYEQFGNFNPYKNINVSKHFFETNCVNKNGNEFLGNKRKPSNIESPHCSFITNNFSHKHLQLLLKDSGANVDMNDNLNLNENNIDWNNLNRIVSYKNSNHSNNTEHENLGTYKGIYGIQNNNNKSVFTKNKINTNREKEINKKDHTIKDFSKRIKNFEIKKIEKISCESNKNESKTNSSSNIFSIQNVPKLNKSNSLLSSMKIFNDKSIKNDNSFYSYNESSKSLCVNTDSGLNKIYDNKKDVPFEINVEKKKPRLENFSDSIDKSFSEKDNEENNFNDENKKEKEYSDIINNIFNDIKREKSESYKGGLFPINGLCYGFYKNPNKSYVNISQEGNKIEKTNKNVFKDKSNKTFSNQIIKNSSENRNNIFNITKKICMNNVRSRLGNVINFKRRKLSIDNIRKKKFTKTRKLSKGILKNSLNQDNICKLANFENALIDIINDTVILNKTILKHFKEDENVYFSQRHRMKSNGASNGIKNKSSIGFNEAGNFKRNRRKTNNLLRKKRKNKKFYIQNDTEATNLTNLNSLNNSNNKSKGHFEHTRTKSNNISRKLFTKIQNENGFSHKSFLTDKKINNSISSSRRISRNSTNNTNDMLKSARKVLKNREKDKSDHNSNIDCIEYLNGMSNSENRFNRRKNKKSESYRSYQNEFIEDKINSLKIEINNYAKDYPKDLELKLLDEKHLFMKNHFPMVYELENFYLFISMKKDNLNKNAAYHSGIPEVLNESSIKEYINNIKKSISDNKNYEFIFNSILTKDAFDITNKYVLENQKISTSNTGLVADRSLSTENRLFSDSNLHSRFIQVNTEPNLTEMGIKADNLIASVNDLKIKTDQGENKVEINKNKDLSKNHEMNSEYKIRVDENLNGLKLEEKISFFNKLGELSYKEEIKQTTLKRLHLENPLAQKRLWSPNILEPSQILYYFEEAGKIWPRNLNWSEEIALVLLNKFGYNIENTLLVLRQPSQEMLSYMTENLTNKSSLNAACKNRSKRSGIKNN